MVLKISWNTRAPAGGFPASTRQQQHSLPEDTAVLIQLMYPLNARANHTPRRETLQQLPIKETSVTLGAWLKTAFQYTPLSDQSLMLNSLYTSQNGVPGCNQDTHPFLQLVCEAYTTMDSVGMVCLRCCMGATWGRPVAFKAWCSPVTSCWLKL